MTNEITNSTVGVTEFMEALFKFESNPNKKLSNHKIWKLVC